MPESNGLIGTFIVLQFEASYFVGSHDDNSSADLDLPRNFAAKIFTQ